MLLRNRYLESDLDCSSDEDEYELVPRKRQKQRGVSVWDGVKVERVEKIPPDINGKKVFELKKSKSGSRMSNVHDGRRWKKDSQTKSGVVFRMYGILIALALINVSTLNANSRVWHCEPKSF